MMAHSDMDRALEQAGAIARLQEASETGKQDRRDIWESIATLREIAAQNKLILSKMEDLGDGQTKLTAKLSEHETRIDERLTALERRDERTKGAMAMLLAIAGGFGGVLTVVGQWALSHFWPNK